MGRGNWSGEKRGAEGSGGELSVAGEGQEQRTGRYECIMIGGSQISKVVLLDLSGGKSLKELKSLGLHFRKYILILGLPFPHFSHAAHMMTNKTLWHKARPG